MTAARRAETVSLGIPAYRDIAAATLAAPADPLARWPPDRHPACAADQWAEIRGHQAYFIGITKPWEPAIERKTGVSLQ